MYGYVVRQGGICHRFRYSGIPQFAAIATLDELTGEIILKVANATDSPLDTSIEFSGLGRQSAGVKVTVITSGSEDDENTIGKPKKVYPKDMPASTMQSLTRRTFPARSLSVLRLSR